MRKYVRLFALAVLAGAAIGIGGIVFLSLENKIVGALMFTAGLYSICVHGLNLFTGKVGYAVEQPKSYIIDLVIIWVGNPGRYMAGGHGGAWQQDCRHFRKGSEYVSDQSG